MTVETILPTPDLFSARRVLCIQPHYDDNDIGAGGTLARLHQAGTQIIYLTVTDDLMGVIDASLSPASALAALKHDAAAAGEIIGVQEHIWLEYPDAGQYDPFALRADLLAHIRRLQPDFIFTPDPWLTYEAHRDHTQTGLAAAEAAIFAGLLKIPSSDPAVDASYPGHALQGIAFYYTREPNEIIDITTPWETKIAAVRCYQAQFSPPDMDQVVMGLTLKSMQVAAGKPFEYGEPLKILHPTSLHCGI